MSLIAFDLDGTLVDQAAAAAAWTAEFVARWALPATATEIIASALSARRPKGVVFDQIVSTWSLPVKGHEAWAEYRERLPKLVSCTDATQEALRHLRAAGWALGIVSNGVADNQEGKIRNTGLAELVDGWVVSSEVGVRKPDRAIFEALAERLMCQLDGWMVGDSLEHDVAGGAAAGLATVWIDPTRSEPSVRVVEPTLTAPSVADAAATILERTTH